MLVIETELKRVEAVAFSPCGQFIAAGGAGVELWSVGCEQVWRVGFDFTSINRAVQRYVSELAFHPNGEAISTMVRGVGVHRLRTRDGEVREYRSTGQAYHLFALSPFDGRVIAGNDGELSSWSEPPPKTTRGNRRAEWTISTVDSRFRGLSALTPDHVLTHEFLNSSSEPRFFRRSATNGEVVEEYRSSFHSLDYFSTVHVDDVCHVLARRGNRVLIWQLDYLHRPPRALTNSTPKAFTDFALHPGGRYLATASNDRSIQLWEFHGATQPTRSFDWHGGRMRSIAFSPDGTIAAAGGDSGQLILFDLDL